jgi:hypothetical protein
MNEIDQLSTRLLEESKRFLEKATESSDDSARGAYMHAALLLGFSSLEAHLNAVAEELAMRPDLGVLDKSILTERDFSLENGRFELTSKLKMYRMEDRLSYIFGSFSLSTGTSLSKRSWWSRLKLGMDFRNKLVHPKQHVQLDLEKVESALESILECLNDLYREIYMRPFPLYNKRLHSGLTF